MAFSLTFRGILDKNIRHVYSGGPTPQISYRHSTEYPNMDQLRQRRENQQLKDYVLRTSEHQSEYDFIPRAPAFRIMSRLEVDKIVRRLQRPTKSSVPRTDNTSEIKAKDSKDQGDAKYIRKVSREEMDEIIRRVCRPTKMSTIREQRPEHLSEMPEMA